MHRIAALLLLCGVVTADAQPFALSPGVWTWLGTGRLCAMPAVLETPGVEPIAGHFLYQDQSLGFCRLSGWGLTGLAVTQGVWAPQLTAMALAYTVLLPYLATVIEGNAYFIRKNREELEALSSSGDITYQFPFWSRPVPIRRLSVSRREAIRLNSLAWGREQAETSSGPAVAVEGLRIATGEHWRWEESPSHLVPVEAMTVLIRHEDGDGGVVPLDGLRNKHWCLRALEGVQRRFFPSHWQTRH